MTNIATTSCVFSNPRPWPGFATPTLPTHQWNYTNQICLTEYQEATTTATISISSSSMPAIASGFTYGEIVNSVWLFLSFVAIAYAFFYFSIAGIKVKK